MRVVVVAMLAGCYAPTAATGVACSPNDTCPDGQRCNLVTRTCDGITPTDGGEDSPEPDAFVLGPWGTPVALAELNTADVEGDPTMTTDLLEIYFASNRDGFF